MPEVWFPNIGFKIDKLPRIAFNIFNISIYSYALCITLGILTGIFLASREAKRIGMNAEIVYDYLTYGIILGVIGARLYYVAFSWDRYKNNLLDIFNIRGGGLAIYGGIIVSIITLYVYTKLKKLNFLKFVDILLPSLAIGQAIGRFGNFFNREVFGGYTESLFAMRYLKAQVDVIPESVAKHIISVNGTDYIQVHPTFLYESLWNVGVCLVLILVQRRKKFDGQVLASYFLLYGVGRAWIEGIRTDQLLVSGLPVSQVLSILFAILALLFLIINLKKSREAFNGEI